MKVAIIHPWFLEYGGGEKVVEVFASMYPDADIFCLAMDPACLPDSLKGRRIHTTGLNAILRGSFRFKRASFMPLFPMAVESMDLRGYDLVISSCGPAVMGVNPGQGAVHISYIHSPQRAWWDLYADRLSKMSGLMRLVFLATAPYIRMFEFSAMQRVDHVVSNSDYIAGRVSQYFRRESRVIYPPVDTSRGYIASSTGGYYLTVSRLDCDKRIDLLIEACNRLRRPLRIAGVGREEKRLRSLAGPTIEFLGRVPDCELSALYANCRAFLFAADEDFGIVPVEAQSFGRPVVAYGHGGSLETVRVNRAGKADTGVYFYRQTVAAVEEAIRRFENVEHTFNPTQIQDHARSFSESIFRDRFSELVSAVLQKRGGPNPNSAQLAVAS
jgi:glycosyltransferase involved in cell wall biosynthesis